jgi:hypothetical protein
MSTSTNWSEEELRTLIDERKTRNEEYHDLAKGRKPAFWEEVADIIYQRHMTYFTGRECNEKFLALTRAYYVSWNRLLIFSV